MADDIIRFGVPRNFDTEMDEAGHKPSKTAAKVVQKRKSTFDKQVGIRLAEVHVLDLAYEEIVNRRKIINYHRSCNGVVPQENPQKRASSVIGGSVYFVGKNGQNQLRLIDNRSKRPLKVESDFTRFVANLFSLTSPLLTNPPVIRTELLQNGVKYRASCTYMGGGLARLGQGSVGGLWSTSQQNLGVC